MKIDLGFVELDLTGKQLTGLRKRAERGVLFDGPCLLLERASGLALDAGIAPEPTSVPVLWTLHAAPWQQWRVVKAGKGRVRILSEHGGLALATEGSSVRLDTETTSGPDQLWTLEPTPDHVAFVITAVAGQVVLDAGEQREPLSAPTAATAVPAAPWQQWMLLRLPLS